MPCSPARSVDDREADRSYVRDIHRSWRPSVPLHPATRVASGPFLARLRNLWVDSGTGEWSIEEAAEFAAGGLEGSLLFF